MHPFVYVRATSVDDALAAGADANTKYLAGGTNLLDLMKGNVEQPTRIIDINRLPIGDVTELPDGGTRIGALAKNSDVANHPLIRERYPLLSQALLSGASPQLRNMASVGGNLLQRTRCGYFTDSSFDACNKRQPGSGCAAREGFNRMHAILGASDQCIAVNPSDMCVALVALDAIVVVRGPRGERRVPVAEFHRLPGASPERDTNLVPGELILGVELPPSRFAARCHYLKVRDRASYAFALVSVAAALDQRNGEVQDARIVLGGVAPKAWRALRAERVLVGSRLEPATVEAAARSSVEGAKSYRDNAFKVELAQRAVVSALQAAGAAA